jgi:hypothetical protein
MLSMTLRMSLCHSQSMISTKYVDIETYYDVWGGLSKFPLYARVCTVFWNISNSTHAIGQQNDHKCAIQLNLTP